MITWFFSEVIDLCQKVHALRAVDEKRHGFV